MRVQYVEPPPRCTSHAYRLSGGFTLVEIVVVLAILTVGLGFMVQTISAVNRLAPVNRESARAVDAARAMVEEMRAANFVDAFAMYNADPADDPAGAGTAPGMGFVAFGLGVRTNDVDGRVGSIEYPTIGDEVREDVVDASLGMPRDLNGDGVIDALDHSGDYEILPFRVRLDWTGATGARSLVVHTSVVAP